jgi:ribosomal protein L44E
MKLKAKKSGSAKSVASRRKMAASAMTWRKNRKQRKSAAYGGSEMAKKISWRIWLKRKIMAK